MMHALSNRFACLLLLPLLGLGSCASTPSTPDDAIEAAMRKRQERRARELARQDNSNQLLLDLDRLMERYYSSERHRGATTVDSFRASAEKIIVEKVTRNIEKLKRIADTFEFEAELAGKKQTVDNVTNRIRAIGALGFSNDEGAFTVLLNALRDDNPAIRANAALALGQLANPATPPSSLGALMDDDKQPHAVRRNASYALMLLQRVYDTASKKEVLPHWIRELQRPMTKHDEAVLLHAIRAVGRLRDPNQAKHIEPYHSHSAALVRWYTAVALGQSGNQSSAEALIALLGEAETNQNVRLGARKALQALAGGVDHKYDVASWRRVFRR